MQVEQLRAFVKENGIEAEFIDHSGTDGLTSRDAASATGMPLSQVIKVLCFVDSKQNKCFVILQGDKRVDSKRIPGLKKGRMASAEELKEWFGFEPGCIPPICLPKEIVKYADLGIKNLPLVVGSAGSRFAGIKLKPEYILNQENMTLAQLSL